MAPLRAVAVAALLSLSVAAGVPVQDQPDIPPGAPASYTFSPRRSQDVGGLVQMMVDRMEPLLESSLARAVESLMKAQRRSEGDEIAALRERLEALERELEELRGDATAPPPTQSPSPETNGTDGYPEPGPTPKPAPEPECKADPDPLTPELAPFERPATLACARSCLDLRDRLAAQDHLRKPQDGTYWFTNMTVPTLCDFSHDGGGWTLLLTAKSRDGWNLLSVLRRRERSPSLDDNYSILEHADHIRDLGSGSRFAYRIETHAQQSRQRWGGVWFAPRSYSFVHEKPDQTEVFNVKRFDKWTYKTNGIKRRMPWLNMHVRGSGNQPAVLTTGDASTNVWGTLLNDEGNTGYQHSPWIHPEAQQSGTVLYWMRENSL